MRQHVEEENFVKLSSIILEIVPKYLRKCFIREWDKKYPDQKWQSNNSNGEFLLEQLPDKIKKKLSRTEKRKRLKSGNEHSWDTHILVFAILFSGLDLTDEVSVREAIHIIVDTRKIYLEHASSKMCPSDLYTKIITDIKNAANKLAGDDAEKEIEEIETSGTKTKTLQLQKSQQEQSHQRKLEDCLKEMMVDTTVIENDSKTTSKGDTAEEARHSYQPTSKSNNAKTQPRSTLNMNLSTEQQNFVKITRIVLDLVPRYLRNCFIAKWDEKFPDVKWLSDNERAKSLLMEKLSKVKVDRRNRVSVQKMEKGNEQDWDTTTVVFALLYSGLDLIQKPRPKEKREGQLSISEAIDILRDTRNVYFAHANSMSCPCNVFENVIESIINATKYLANEAEIEIQEIVSSQIEVMIDQQRERVQYEKDRQEELDMLAEIQNDIRDLKSEFRNGFQNLQDKVEKALEEKKVPNEQSIEDYINEKSKKHRDELCSKLSSWKIRLINAKGEDGKLFVWNERNRVKYTAELRISQTRKLNQEMQEELRMFVNKSGEDGGILHYDELISAKDRRCFLRGVAGIGKTSLIEYIALKWAKRELFLDENGNPQFDFFFLVKCRELGELENETMKEFFEREFDVDTDKLKDHGDRILIVVDGLDEDANLHESIKKKAKLGALVQERSAFLTNHATIITGRPHIESIIDGVEDEIGEYKRIEVTGLSQEEIDKHVDVIANDNKEIAAKIKQTIHSSTNMSALAAIPQYLQTICCVIAMQGERATMSTETITPLYVWTLASFWAQHVQGKEQQVKGLYKILKDKNTARFLIELSSISYKLLKENMIIFNKEVISHIEDMSEENGEMFKTFFIELPSQGRPSYQFKHLTLHEFFAATHCMLNRIKIADILELKLYEVVRFIGGFIAAKESSDKGNIVKIYIECLEEADKEQEKSIDVSRFFNCVLDFLEHLPKVKGEFAQHYALSLFHEVFEKASGKKNKSLAGLNIDIIPRFQKVVGDPAFIYYAMSQIELSYLVHFIDSLFANDMQDKLNEITVRIRFATLKDNGTIKKLFKSFLFFKNVWFTYCDLSSYPWEMMNESGSSPEKSKLYHLYINRCRMSGTESKQLAHFIPFAEKVELIDLELSDANCQEMIDAITKEHGEGKATLKELKMNYCHIKGPFRKKFMNLKKVEVYIIK